MPVKNLRQRKTELRSRFKKLRKGLDAGKKAQLDSLLAEGFLSLPEYKAAGVIFAFISKDIETDTGKIISEAMKDGKRVAVPVCDTGTTTIDFYYIKSYDDLVPGVFGLEEPDTARCERAEPRDCDVCIVPGLAFDREGYRLGFGKGYYDRFLGEYSGPTVALCYSFCIVPELPRGFYDRPVSFVVTDKYTIKGESYGYGK